LVRVAGDLPPLPTRDLYLVYHRALRDVPRIAVLRTWLVELAQQWIVPAEPGGEDEPSGGSSCAPSTSSTADSTTSASFPG
jgi:hypothetical protein